MKKIKNWAGKKFNSKYLISKELEDAKSILDVGCGRESILYGINLSAQTTGMDFYKPYIDKSKSKKIHDKYVLHDITKTFPFKDNSFDKAICTEVLEHIEKKKGLQVIKEVERVAKNQIILTTPNGLTRDMKPRKHDNPKEKHVSGWEVRDLKKLGFTARGLHGFKFLRNDIGEIKYKPTILFRTLSFLSKPLAYYFPQKAYQLYFYKKLNKRI